MPVGLEEHVGRVLGARYRLIAPIGTGASAVVFLAEDLTLRRRVAVKVLHPGLTEDSRFRRRFRAEAHASAQLAHPHLVSVFDWSDATEVAAGQRQPAYLVTELLTGGSLRALLDTGERLSLSQALLVGLHAAQGLAHAHRQGFVHRDIKPANLLFDAEGRLRIADFGIARAIAEATWTEPEGALVGTARYAAPEQASGDEVEGRSDVYALAVTLIEAVTGEIPLGGPTALATLVARQGVDLAVSPAMGPLGPILREAGRARPADRLTAAQLAEALLRLAPTLPRPEPLPLTPLVAASRSASAESPLPMVSGLDATVDLRSAPVPAGSADPTVVDVAEPEGAGTGGGGMDRGGMDSGGMDRGGADSGGPVGLDPASLQLEHQPSGVRRWHRLLLAVAVIAVVMGALGGAYALLGEGAGITSPASAPVGSFVGRSVADVEAEAEANGWAVARTTTREDGFEAGTIVRQAPPPGTRLEEGSEITLVVSEGFVLRTVPQLEGLPLPDALANLSAADLLMGATAEEHSETVPTRHIIRASLPAGQEVEGRVTVDIVWSLGPAPRLVPELAGQPKAEAEAALVAAGLVVEVAEDYSQSVPEGVIVSIDPPSGAIVDRGSTVRLIVSLGLPFVKVPNVSGLAAVEAADRLEDAGFDVVDTVGPPNAEVLATSPPAGEAVRQGSDVVIFTRQ